MYASTIAYFSSLVTPGLGAAGHILRFSKRLIKEDLPTFGYPTIPARTLRQNKNKQPSKHVWLITIFILNDQDIIKLQTSSKILVYMNECTEKWVTIIRRKWSWNCLVQTKIYECYANRLERRLEFYDVSSKSCPILICTKQVTK